MWLYLVKTNYVFCKFTDFFKFVYVGKSTKEISF